MNLKEEIFLHTKSLLEDRRWLHQHAETAWNEHKTTAYIEKRLLGMGLKPHRFDCQTGCWCLIEGTHAENKGRTILLRADIDAMPGVDRKDVPYRSINEGAVHSCGHDGHTAMLLTAAELLMKNRSSLKGNIKLVFEPAEELSVGGEYCVSQGVLEGTDAAFAIHLWDALDEGTIDIADGPCMAGFHGFSISITGRSNTCSPKDGADAILAVAKVIDALQLIHTNFIDPFREPTTLTLGKLHGGLARNASCDHVVLEGVIRTFYRGSTAELRSYIERIAKEAALLNGCSADIIVEDGLGPVIHDSGSMIRITKEAAKKTLGSNALIELGPNLGGDTFASYSSRIPGIYARLGVRKPGMPADKQYMLHDDRFDFDDSIVLPKGTALFIQVVMDYFGIS